MALASASWPRKSRPAAPSPRNASSPASGVPASSLSAIFSEAWPCDCASCASVIDAALAGTSRSMSSVPLSRCSPRCHAEPSTPRHQSAGSNCAMRPAPLTCQPPRVCRSASPANSARAAPACTAAWRSTIRRGVADASRSSCTLCVSPPCGSSPSTRPRSARVGSRCAAGVVAFGANQSSACSRALPPRRIGGARASSACGAMAAKVASSTARDGVQCPVAVTLPARSRSVPSSSASCRISICSTSSGRARNSARSDRTGSRPSSLRPARALSSFTSTVAGRSAATLSTATLPLSAVRGAPL